MSYIDIARNIENRSSVNLNKAMRIARTEGHRVTQVATYNAQKVAKDSGADIVKQWDSTLDRRTRKSHQKVDGEIKELDEPFSNGLMYPGDPNGKASEVVNCRCVLLQRAKWGLDEEELETLKRRAEYFGLDKAEGFECFKERYLFAEQTYYMQHNLPKGFKDTRTLGEFISPIDLDEFIRTAQEKGIKIGHQGTPTGGFELYRGNVSILYELIDELENQLTTYAIDDIILMYDDVLGYKGDDSMIDIGCFAMTKGRTITLNRFMFDDSNFLKDNYNRTVEENMFVKGSTYVNVITHEMGHIIQRQRKVSSKSIEDVIENLAVLENVSLTDYIKNHISEYALAYNGLLNEYTELVAEINVLSVCNTESDIIKLLKRESVLK